MAALRLAVCALALFAFVQVSSACCYDGFYGGYGYPGYGYGGCGCEPIVVDVDTFCAPTCGGYGYGGYGYGFPGYGYGYGFDDCCCCCEPVTEITTVSCVPVVETFIEPCGCGFDGFYGGYGYGGFPGYYGGYGYDFPGFFDGCYDGFYGGYGYGGFPGYYGGFDGFYGGYGYGYPGYGYGYGCEPIVVDVDTFCAPTCGGYGYGGYGYGGYGCGCDCCCCCEPVTEITTVSCVPVVETFIEPCGCGFDGFYGGYGYGGFPGYYGGYDGFYGGYPGYGYGGCGCGFY